MRYKAPAIFPDGTQERDALIAVQKRTGGIEHAAFGPVPSYTVAQLQADTPAAASYVRCLVYVSDGASDKYLAISNGTAWFYAEGTAV